MGGEGFHSRKKGVQLIILPLLLLLQLKGENNEHFMSTLNDALDPLGSSEGIFQSTRVSSGFSMKHV